jgi:hypothetical protein
MYDRMPPKLPFYWNSVIPATLDTALTFDEMQSKIVWTVNKILENQYLTVPYLINLSTEYTTTSISIKGILFQNYTPLQVDKEFVINGMKDGTYYINVFNDAANTEAGKPPVQSNDLLFLSTEYMPKNCTSLYVFDILNGNIVGNSIRYNDLYTEMHNADPNAHQALFEAVYNKIEEESDGLHNEIVTETNRAKQAEQQLQDNIDNESTARQQADTTLQNNINAEKTARENADTTLQNNINAEKTAREQADTALGERITAETTARQQADTNLQNSINAEKTAREQADTTLQNNINAEKTARENADTALQDSINTHIQNKNNPHNVTADQIGNVVKTIKGANQTILYGDVTLTGRRGVNTVGTGQNINIEGPMYSTPADNSVDVLYSGITALSSNIAYTSEISGLPSKTGWLYLVSYQVGQAYKKVIYNLDGTIYYTHGRETDTWIMIENNSGVESINDLTGIVTLVASNGNNVAKSGNTLNVSGPMLGTPPSLNLDEANTVGIYSLRVAAIYTSTRSGLPEKDGWLYMVVYPLSQAANKQVIYNKDGTAYWRDGVESNWNPISYGGTGTAGVSSINSLTGALTLNGDQGVSVTTTVNALHVSGQYYVLTQNTPVNATLRPGITTKGSYSFTGGPENETLIAIETVDSTSGSYNFFQVGYCSSGNIYVRRTNTNGTATTEWIKSGVFSFNNKTGNINVDGRYGNIVENDTSSHFFVNGPIRRLPTLDANTYDLEGIASFDYGTLPTNIPGSSTKPFMLFQVRTNATDTNTYYTQWLIDKSNGKMYTRTKNKNGSQATTWYMNSYSPALDNQTVTLESLAPNLGIQNLTLQLEHYRGGGQNFKAKFYVPFAVSNSNSPLTEIALWSLPQAWTFDEDQYIPVYIRSVSSGASSFGYIQCSNNAMQLIIGGTGQSIPAGWVVRFCNSDVYLIRSSS